MKPWAERIGQLLEEQSHLGKNEAGIAKACGIAKNSVSQWFGRVKGKEPTGTLKVESALKTAKYLGTTAEWIVFGRGQKDASQELEFDPEILGQAFVATEKAARAIGVKYDAAQVPELLIWAYQQRPRFKPGRNKDDLAEFDAIVRGQLEWEMGRDKRATRSAAAESGVEDAQATANRLKNRGSGR